MFNNKKQPDNNRKNQLAVEKSHDDKDHDQKHQDKKNDQKEKEGKENKMAKSDMKSEGGCSK